MNKEEIVNIINNINVEGPYKKAIVDFINTYDGTNEKEFGALVRMLVDLLHDNIEFGIKAEAYEAIKANHEILNKNIENLKKEYSNIQNGKIENNMPILDIADDEGHYNNSEEENED
jgi:hypothetical protein